MKNLRIINFTKKLLAVLFMFVTLFSTAQPIFAVSSSGSGKWVSGQYDSNIYTTDNKYQVGTLVRRLVNSVTGEKITVFCAEFGVNSPTGEVRKAEHSIPDNPQTRKACKIAYLGWYIKYGDYVVNGGILAESKRDMLLDYVFTQQYVWEALGQSSATFKKEDIQSQYEDFKKDIDNKMKKIETRPSFVKNTITIECGETKILTDTNNVLKDYNSIDVTKDKVRIQHEKGENTMKITVSEDCSIDTLQITDRMMKNWGCIKEGTVDKDTTIYFTFEDKVQNQLYSLDYNDPVTMSLNLKIEQLGNLKLEKLNTNGDLIDGSIFTINGPGYNGDVEVKNGRILLEKLKKGTYTIKEKSSGNGYLINEITYKAEVFPNQTTTQVIVNKEPIGEITLTKTDKDTGNSNRIDGISHHGDANLKGTEYTFYADEDIYNVEKTVRYFSKDEEIAKFVFDEYGKATVIVTNKSTPASLSVDGNTLKGLPMGSFYAKETYVVEGYMQDTVKHSYTFSYKDTNTPVITINDVLKNEVQKAKFEIIKISSNTNTTAPVIENAEFTAILTKYVTYYGSFEEALKHLDQYAEDEYSIFKTQSNGHGVSGLLAYGEYTCYETNTPSDKINTVQPFYIKIDRNSDGVIKEFVENDTPFESYLKLVKVNKNTGKKVTLSNATFKLDRLNEETNQWEKVACKLGRETFDSWKTDENATAYTETKMKAGTYRISELVIPNGFLELNEDIVFEVSKSNKTLEFDKDYDAYITVTVENEQPTGTLEIDKSVAIREGVDTSLIDISDLSGIKFKLLAKEDIIDYADGSIIYEKGKEIGQYNLTKEGKLLIENLHMGSYELEEISTLEGLVLDTTKHEIIFKQENNKTKIYIKKEKLVNDTTIVEFSKTDITGDKELDGATLTVTDMEGNIIDKWISGKKAHKIEGLKVGKKYILKEEIQVDSYVKATDIEFTVENTNEIQKVTMIDKIVDMSKVDIGGNEIEGAKMQVLDLEGNIIDEWISGKEAHKIKNLEEGKTYILHEDVCVDGFVKATDIEFVVTVDKETQHLKMIDKIVNVIKTDMLNGDLIDGAELIVTDEEGNEIDRWISSSKEPHHVSGLEEGKKYFLEEKSSPYGYEIASKQEFIVELNKETQIIEMKDMPILTNIRLIKIDEETKEIIKDKFKFALYEDKECTKLIKEYTSNSKEGFVEFNDLRYGIYFCKELSAPKNYNKSDSIIKLEINDKGVFINDNQIENKDSIYSFEFANTKKPKIQTGTEINYIILIGSIVISILTILVGIITLKRKK